MSFGFTKENNQKLPKLNIEESIISNINNNTINNKILHSTPNRVLYTRKLNDEEKSAGDINKLIYDSFNDPSEYFCENSPVHVGSKIKLKKLDLISRKEVKRQTRMQQKRDNTSYIANDTKNSSYFGKKKQASTINTSKKYEIIDNNALKKIFENFKLENNKNKHLRNNEMSLSRNVNNLNKTKSNNSEENSDSNTNNNNNVYPFDLCRSLNYQNKQMKNQKKNIKKVTSLSKFISKKTDKNEDDLLMNKVDLFKYKKEILMGLSQEKPREEKFGKFQWNMDLRRPINFIGLRQLHINVNNERNPFWGILVERSPDDKEMAVKPGYNLNQKEFIKFINNKNIQKNKKYINNVKNLDELNVNGTNLLDLEYKREMSTKGKKILHKVFIENGKTVMEHEINKVFGEETIYKNYENKNKYINASSEGENMHQKYNKKKSRLDSSITRNRESRNNSNIFNNAQTSQTEI